MAADISNIDGAFNGNQQLGRVTINQNGRLTVSKPSGDEDTIPIADIDDKYDTRFDDVTYYE